MSNRCTFDDAESAAAFCVVLTREGIAFYLSQQGDTFVVNITGF